MRFNDLDNRDDANLDQPVKAGRRPLGTGVRKILAAAGLAVGLLAVPAVSRLVPSASGKNIDASIGYRMRPSPSDKKREEALIDVAFAEPEGSAARLGSDQRRTAADSSSREPPSLAAITVRRQHPRRFQQTAVRPRIDAWEADRQRLSREALVDGT